MKFKLLTMLFAIGLMAFGTGVSAQAPAGGTKKLSQTQLNDAANKIVADLKAGGFADSALCTVVQLMDPKCKTCSTFSDAVICIKRDDTVAAQLRPVCDKVGATTIPLIGSICTAPGDIGKHATAFLKAVCCNLNPQSDEAEKCIEAGGDSCSGPAKKCTKDTDCTTKGQTCDKASGKCITPAKKCTKDADCTTKGQTCDKASGKCITPTGGCSSNKDCSFPKSWCSAKKCGTPPAGKCVTNQDCTNNQTCVSGSCKAPSNKCTTKNCAAPAVCASDKCVCGPNKITCNTGAGEKCTTVSKGIKCCKGTQCRQ